MSRGAKIGARVKEAAALLGISDLLNAKPRELSGGQRQRVALGRAIVRRPAILLLDEPLSNLDAPLCASIRADLESLRSRLPSTFIFVTHDQAEALSLGDRVAVLDRGRIEQVGAPRDLLERPASLFVAAFLGSPPANALSCTVKEIDGRTAIHFDGFDAILDAPDGSPVGELILALRPESILVEKSSGFAVKSASLNRSAMKRSQRLLLVRTKYGYVFPLALPSSGAKRSVSASTSRGSAGSRASRGRRSAGDEGFEHSKFNNSRCNNQ